MNLDKLLYCQLKKDETNEESDGEKNEEELCLLTVKLNKAFFQLIKPGR